MARCQSAVVCELRERSHFIEGVSGGWGLTHEVDNAGLSAEWCFVQRQAGAVAPVRAVACGHPDIVA
jgi:hypothetical protein